MIGKRRLMKPKHCVPWQSEDGDHGFGHDMALEGLKANVARKLTASGNSGSPPNGQRAFRCSAATQPHFSHFSHTRLTHERSLAVMRQGGVRCGAWGAAVRCF